MCVKHQQQKLIWTQIGLQIVYQNVFNIVYLVVINIIVGML